MKKNLSETLFYMAIFLLPYEAIPGILPSTYRPIAIYPLFILSIIAIVNCVRTKKIDKTLTRVLVWAFVSAAISFFVTYFRYGRYDRYLDFLITVIMGVAAFTGANYGFHHMNKEENNEYIDKALVLLGKAYYIPIFIGILEFLSIIGILPYSIKLLINQYLGGGQLGRLCMGTAEASWTALHQVVAVVVYFLLYKIYKKKKYVFSLAFMLFAFTYNVSGQGLTTVVFAMIIFYILYMVFQKNIHKLFKTFVLMAAVAIIGAFILKTVLSILPASYYTVRFQNMFDIDKLIRTDGSIFIRLIYPYIDFNLFLKNPIIGIGGGNFSYELGSYVSKWFPWALLQYEEVVAHIRTCNTGTASMYIRILGELGIVGAVLFGEILRNVLLKVRRMKNTTQFMVLLFLFSFIIAIPIEFDSFAYVLFWVLLAFFNNIKNERR